MADDKKEPRSKKMYGKTPHIDKDSGEGDVNRSGNEQGARKKAAETAGKPETKGDMTSAAVPKADLMSGTDGIPTHDGHSEERGEMHHRHMREHADMHHRHERDHLRREMGKHSEDEKMMHARHHKERQAMHTDHEREMKSMQARHSGALGEEPEGATEDVGTSGTNE